MQYVIGGMTCNACKAVIEMTFEERGYQGCRVDLERATLHVPDNFSVQQSDEDIAKILAEAGGYTVVNE